MIDLAEKQRQRAVADRRTYLVNELYKLGKFDHDTSQIDSLSLVDLENIHINEKCRAARAFGDRS